VLYYFKYLIQGEVIRWFQPPVFAAPWAWCSFFAVRFKLQKTIIYTIKKNFILVFLSFPTTFSLSLLCDASRESNKAQAEVFKDNFLQNVHNFQYQSFEVGREFE
jgi:hypothetical protein